VEKQPAPPSWAANGRPNWAQERFDCLVFTVDGLKLAVPLLLLGNIHKLDKELTPLFDQPGWFLGLLPIQQDRNIRVVDTGQLVMPERYKPESVDLLAYAVGVHDSDWAFGAHSIEGSVTLEPDEVKWRSLRTSRPWLAGTVISEMCALVDLDAFSKVLQG
jgi:purine-binding chemotaxis protein CheW